MKARLLLLSTVAVVCAGQARAQTAAPPPTTIVADIAPGLSLGTNVTNTGTTYTIDGGRVAGTNLFHSFSMFDLGSGDTASWVHSGGDASSIGNVINRVTGGTPSSIFGTLDSTALPSADFFFVNPAGIIFGEGAQVNVPAAAHFSTASELRFANGDSFAVATPTGSTLSVSNPASFGFLGGEGAILLQNIENGDTTFLANGGELTMSAADIRLDYAFVGSRALTLTAVGDSPAEVGVDGSTSDTLSGSLELVNYSWLQTWPGGCYEDCMGYSGQITLKGGNLLLDGAGIAAEFDSTTDEGGISSVQLLAGDSVRVTGSVILADGYGIADAGSVSIVAGGDVDVIDSMLQSYSNGAGDGGTIEIRGVDVRIGGTLIGSESYDSGDAGEVLISGQDVELTRTDINSAAFGSGGGGNVAVEATNQLLLTASSVATTTAGPGGGGDILLSAASVTIEGAEEVDAEHGFPMYASSRLSAGTEGAGDAGSIQVQASEQITLTAADMLTDTSGTGDGGGIFVSAPSVIIQDAQQIDPEYPDVLYSEPSILTADTNGLGNAGSISITAESLVLLRSRLSSSAFCYEECPGAAGGISITGATVLLNEADLATDNGDGPGGNTVIGASESIEILDSRITSETSGVGDAGEIAIDGAAVVIRNSEIFSDTHDFGAAGSVLISGGDIAVNNGYITSESLGDSGRAGTVSLEAEGNLDLSNLSRISTSTFGDGPGGSVVLRGARMTIADSAITTESASSGAAGGILMAAGSLDLTNAHVSSFASDDGDAGSVALHASGPLTITGTTINSDSTFSRAGDILLHAGSAELTRSTISSSNTELTDGGNGGGSIVVSLEGDLEMESSELRTDAMGWGNAGSISISATNLSASRSRIGSDSVWDGDAGSVAVLLTGHLSMANGSVISSDSTYFSSGAGGDVLVRAQSASLIGGSSVSSDAGAHSNAGNVNIEVAGQLLLRGRSKISSSIGIVQEEGAGGGFAGDVSVIAGDLIMDHASIGSSASDTGEGGSVAVSVAGTMTMIGSTISAQTGGPGDAGSVTISAGRSAHLAGGSRVSTNSVDGAAGNITFNMPAQSILMLSGAQSPGTIETSSGAGTGGRIIIANPLAIISNGGSILALGESGGANVQIDTPYFITSSDRANRVAVDGTLSFSSGIYDVSAGTTDVDLSVLDASGVLRGQCGSALASGDVSQLNIRPSGPFGITARSQIDPQPDSTAGFGGCQ